MTKVRIIRRSNGRVIATGEALHKRPGVFYVRVVLPQRGWYGRELTEVRPFKSNRYRYESV